MIGRRSHHHNSSSIAGCLAPEARKPPPKNFHRENIQQMQQRENEIQRKREEEQKKQQDTPNQWKMRRFQSVESKVARNLGQENQEPPMMGQAQNQAQQPARKMTKAEAMKLRMAQERGQASGLQQSQSQANVGAGASNQSIQMENVQSQRQAKPPMAARESAAKPLPPRAPPKTNLRQSQQAPAESIFNWQGDQPIVVQYNPDQVSAPEPVKQPPPKRNPPVYMGRTRASSVQNRAAQNAGRQILSSQGSQKQVAAANGKAPKDAVPKADQVNQLKNREQKNFVKANMNKAIFEMQPPEQAKENEPTIAGKNKNYGKVPSYINKYKNQREDAAKQKAFDIEMAKHPPGTRLMPEEERQETLRDLQEAKAETNRQLEKLPVVAHSAKMERHKKELEEKLGRLDKAIETFSKPTVYVAM